MKYVFAAFVLLMIISTSLLPQAYGAGRIYEYAYCKIPLLALEEESGRGFVVYVNLWVIPSSSSELRVEVGKNVAEDTKRSIELAVLYASMLAGVSPSAYRYIVDTDVEVEGLSATLGFFVAALLAIATGSCNPRITATGVIGPGGVVGSVGGLLAKVEASRSIELQRLYIPVQQVSIVKDNLSYVKGVHSILDVYEDVLGLNLSKYELNASIVNKYNEYFRDAYIELKSNATRILNELRARWLDKHLKDAEEAAKLAEEYARLGKYYVAASLAYRALVSSQVSYLNYTLTKSWESGLAEIKKILLNADEYVEHALKSLASVPIYTNASVEGLVLPDLLVLDALVNTAVRALEARYYIWLASLAEDVEERIILAANAYSRALSALTWLELSRSIARERGTVISSPLRERVKSLLDIYRSVHIGYLSVLGINLTLLAQLLSASNSDVAALAEVAFAANLVYRYTGLSRVFTSNLTARDVYEWEATLLKYVSMLEEVAGAIPVYPIVLLDLVQAYLEEGISAEEVLQLIYSGAPLLAGYLYLYKGLSYSAGSALETHGYELLKQAAILIAPALIVIGLVLVVKGLKDK